MANEALEKIEFSKGDERYRILIEYDEFPENPRTMSGDSPIGLFAIPNDSRCTHLCDNKWDHKVSRWLLVPYDDEKGEQKIPFFHGDPTEGEEASVTPIAVWSLGKGEHGPGTIQIYIGRYLNGDTWDSGQVGWVFSTAEAWKERQGTDWVETVENLKRLEEMVRDELKEYGQYCRGQCYRYSFEKYVPECEHGHGEEWVDADGTFDACGGFIGEYPTYGGCVEAACWEAGIECPEKFKPREVKAA